MKKILNISVSFTIILLCSKNTNILTLGFQGARGYGLAQQETGGTRNPTSSTSTTTDGSCSDSGGTCCSSGQTCCQSGQTCCQSGQCCPNGCANTSDSETSSPTYSIPSFNINLLSSDGKTIIKSHQFTTPSFTLSTAMLEVHIFPPSNSVNPTTNAITYSSGQGEGTYIVAYTIKDPAGTIVHKEFDILNTLTSLPHGISITSQSTKEQPATTYVSTNFLPALSTSLSDAQKTIVLNGISPIIQKFVIQNNSATPTITPISGMYDADNTTSTTPTYSGIAQFSTTPTTGAKLRDLTIAFTTASNSNAQNSSITFAESTQVIFNQQDLANGLVLNIVIFPASSSTSYPVVATLRTLDGLKMRKKHAINTNPLSFIPTTISIIHGNNNATTLLTTSFLNSSITNNLFTMISPLNLRFLISRPIGSTNFMVLMV